MPKANKPCVVLRATKDLVRNRSFVSLRRTIFLVVLASPLRAQVPTPEAAIVTADQPRWGTRWRVVHSPHFDIFHPIGSEKEAQRTAATLEHVRPALGTTMGGPPRRTKIVLQDQSTVSNAYMALGPRRQVWVMAPPAFPSLLGTGDWLTLLAVHETRHTTQQDRTDVGFTRVGRLLFGDLGLTLLSHVAVPGWMWEGDAVGTETAFTAAGRGRMPDFDKEIRSLAIDDRLPGYYEAMLGSYRNFFPNQYPLGYLLTTNVRTHEGPDAVDRLFRTAAATSYNPLAFHRAAKKVTGQTPPRLYARTMAELTTRWKSEVAALSITPAKRLTETPHSYTSYEDPQYLSDGTVVAVAAGFDYLRSIVRVDSGGVRRLAEAPTYGDVRAGGKLVAWTEIVPDWRWGWSDATRIRLLDVATGKVRTVGEEGRLAFPNPSPDGQRIAAIELRPLGASAVVVLDAETGARIFDAAVPDGDHAMDPSWRADGNALVLTRQGKVGKALSILDLESRDWTDVIPHGDEDVTRPVFAGRHILYVSPLSGMDNVYAIDPRNGARFQVTSRRVGAYQPAVSPDGARLLFADYTSDGFAVAEAVIDTAAWMPIAGVTPGRWNLFDPLMAQEKFTIQPLTTADTVYPTGRVRLRDVFDVHSWNLAGNPGAGEIGARFFTTNVLNTVSSQLKYVRHGRERANETEATISYAGFHPIVDLSGRRGTRAATYDAGSGGTTRYTWQENAVDAGLRLPINLSRGNWSRQIWLGAQISNTHVSGLSSESLRPPGNGTFAPVTTGLTVENVKRPATRDAGPRAGFALTAENRSAPFGGDFSARKFAATGQSFLPGLWSHHAIRMAGTIENHRPQQGVRFSSDITPARGYGFVFGERMVRGSADYVAPIAYPDLSLGPVLYIPRVRAGAFGDYFRASTGAAAARQTSAGIQIAADVIPFTWSFLPLTAGARLVRRFQDSRWVVEPVIGGVY